MIENIETETYHESHIQVHVFHYYISFKFLSGATLVYPLQSYTGFAYICDYTLSQSERFEILKNKYMDYLKCDSQGLR